MYSKIWNKFNLQKPESSEVAVSSVDTVEIGQASEFRRITQRMRYQDLSFGGINSD